MKKYLPTFFGAETKLIFLAVENNSEADKFAKTVENKDAEINPHKSDFDEKDFQAKIEEINTNINAITDADAKLDANKMLNDNFSDLNQEIDRANIDTLDQLDEITLKGQQLLKEILSKINNSKELEDKQYQEANWGIDAGLGVTPEDIDNSKKSLFGVTPAVAEEPEQSKNNSEKSIDIKNLTKESLNEQFIKDVEDFNDKDYQINKNTNWKEINMSLAEDLDLKLDLSNDYGLIEFGTKIQAIIGMKENEIDGKIGPKTMKKIAEFLKNK